MSSLGIFRKIRRVLNLSLLPSLLILSAVTIGVFWDAQLRERRALESQARELLSVTADSSLVRTYAEYRSYGLGEEAVVFEGFIREDLASLARGLSRPDDKPPLIAFSDATGGRTVAVLGARALEAGDPAMARIESGLGLLGASGFSRPPLLGGAPYRMAESRDYSGQRLRLYIELANPSRRLYLAFLVGSATVVLLLVSLYLGARQLAHSAIKRITDPIERLTEISRSVMEGRRDLRAAHETEDEIGSLADAFNKMLDELTGLLDERGRAVESLRASLAERDILLKEVHHRVKNNMQVISSMIYLQRASLGEGEAAEILLTAENRVRSMALVHERLYQTNEFAAIELRSFLEDLVAAMAEDSARLWTVEGEEVSLDLDRAVPCSLAVSELVMNAMKHGKGGGGQAGGYFIRLRRTEGLVSIAVGDRGPGVSTLGGPPPEAKEAPGKGIGLTLVRALAQQLHGKLAMADREGGGAIFTFSFPSLQG